MAQPLRNRLRPAMHAVHRWAGIVTAALLFCTAATGLGLLLTDVANWRGHRLVPQGHGLADITPALANAAADHPEYALTNVLLPRDARHAWIALLRHTRTDDRVIADIDPYTGRLLGYRDFDRTVFRVLLDFHYTYFAGAGGKIAATVVSLALIVLSGTGIWLYRGLIRGLFRFRNNNGAARDALTWFHKWSGAWALTLALIWGVTGFSQMMTILPNAFSAPRRFVASSPAQLRTLPPTGELVKSSLALVPGAELVSFSPPAPGKTEMRFFMLRRDAWPWSKRTDVLFNAKTGAITRVVRPVDMKTSERFNAAVHALHFGFYSPTTTLVVYLAGALLLLTLPVTGVIMWWRRRLQGNAV